MPRGNCPKSEAEQAGCKYAPACFSDLHHEYWPAADYAAIGELAVRWRNLGDHTIQLCRAEHDNRHATELPPPMPSHDQIIDDLAATNENLPRRLRSKINRSIARRAIGDNSTEAIDRFKLEFRTGFTQTE